jgi:hypothetical protein
MKEHMDKREVTNVTFVVTQPQTVSTIEFTRKDIPCSTTVMFVVRVVVQRVSWKYIEHHMVANLFDALYVTNSMLARRLCSTTRKCFTQMLRRKQNFMLVMFVGKPFLRSRHSCITAYHTQDRNHINVINVTKLTHINTIWPHIRRLFTLILQLKRLGISVKCVVKLMPIKGHCYFI